jgi:hypothetical protein
MNNLKDTTFIIPVRIDSTERARNLQTIVKYLNKYFDTNIIVLEDASESKVPGILANCGNYKYMFRQTSDELFHRTKILNIMTKEATTPIIANYDCDVLFHEAQYLKAVSLIRNNQADFVFPYNGKFVGLSGETVTNVVNNLSVNGLTESSGGTLHPSSVGGCIIFDKKKFMNAGMENENFISWGWEDTERVERFKKLGYKVVRVEHPLFHLYHPPSLNSSNDRHANYAKNEQEYHKVNGMNIQQLREYIRTWSWLK